MDNRPAHRLGPVDGLRSGGSPPRQDPLSRGLIAMTGSEKASAKALPLARLRPPAFAGLRDHDRTIGLGRRFRPPAAPLLAPIEHPHPIPHRPDSKAPDAIQGPSGPVFSCLPVCASVLGCAAADGPCAESPRSARPQRPQGNKLLNPIPGDTPKRQRLRPLVTGSRRDFA